MTSRSLSEQEEEKDVYVCIFVCNIML